VYYAHMRKVFEENRQILNWAEIRVKDLDVKTLENYLGTEQYKLINRQWDEVTPKSFEITEDWMLQTNKWLENIDELSIRSKWWLMEDFTPETRKYFQEYMATISKWGHFADTTTEAIVAKIVNHANVLPLVGNVSVILKQSLSMFDAMWHEWIWAKWMLGAIRDLHSNPNVFKKLYDVEAIKVRWGWDFLLKELNDWLINNKALSVPYNKYIQYWTMWMKYTDQYIYGQIFYWAYKNYMIKNNLAHKWAIIDDFSHPRASAFAEDIANKVSSTANPLWLPSIYRNAYAKSFFGIFTTQLNRVQEVTNWVSSAIKEWRYGEAVNRATFFFASNLAEIWMTYWIGKFLYEIWATDYKEYWKDLSENIFTSQTIYRMSLWQTFVWSKADSIISGFSTSPVLWLWDKVARDLRKIYEWAKEWEFETVTDWWLNAIKNMFWWKLADQIIRMTD
jgi:hypothetical protein